MEKSSNGGVKGDTSPHHEGLGEGQEMSKAQARGAWGNQLEFILTCVGYAVGLGNVWRFPYLTFANGGGAFLIPYFCMLILCGIPVFFFELCFGQFASLGPLAIWTINPMLKGIGVGMVCISTMVALSYHILLAYILFFFFASLSGTIPWQDCDNDWNTYQCFSIKDIRNVTYLNETLEFYNMTRADIKTPSEEYFYNHVLQLSSGIDDSGEIVWQLALCLFIAWFVVFLVLIKGIKSLGKVVYFTSTFPYIMMTIMVIQGANLKGAVEGIKFYLTPDFSYLTELEVWADAASQIFYSLSTCTGGLIAMASYNRFNNNLFRDSLLIPIINCLTSLYAGFAIFTVLGFMAELKGVEVDQVAASGPGLVFVVYPEGLSQMDVAPLWSILFFFMMLTLGFSSAFSMVEGVFVAIMDEFSDTIRATPYRPILFRGISCLIFYLISLPMVTKGGFYLFNIVDSFAGGFPRLFTGVFELVAVIWVYGLGKFSEDVCLMLGRKPPMFFKVTWGFLSPVIVTFLIISKAVSHKRSNLFNGEYVYPAWADTMGWMMVAFVVVWVPVVMVVRWFMDGGWQVVKKSSSPTPAWGPALPENRLGTYADQDLRRSESEDVIDNVSVIPMTHLNGVTKRASIRSKGSGGIENGSFHL